MVLVGGANPLFVALGHTSAYNLKPQTQCAMWCGFWSNLVCLPTRDGQDE